MRRRSTSCERIDTHTRSELPPLNINSRAASPLPPRCTRRQLAFRRRAFASPSAGDSGLFLPTSSTRVQCPLIPRPPPLRATCPALFGSTGSALSAVPRAGVRRLHAAAAAPTATIKPTNRARPSHRCRAPPQGVATSASRTLWSSSVPTRALSTRPRVSRQAAPAAYASGYPPRGTRRCHRPAHPAGCRPRARYAGP